MEGIYHVSQQEEPCRSHGIPVKPPGELAWQHELASPRSIPSWCLQTSLHWHKGKFKLTAGFLLSWAERSSCRCVEHGLQFVALAEDERLQTCLGMMIKNSEMITSLHRSSLNHIDMFRACWPAVSFLACHRSAPTEAYSCVRIAQLEAVSLSVRAAWAPLGFLASLI